MESSTVETDVAIVGAGLAGLAAARSLVAAGVDPVLLEARDRVGGRVFDRPIDGGAVVELGAGFVGPGQDRMLALSRETGVELFATHTAGKNLLEVGGRHVRYSGTIPRLRPLALLDAGRAQFKLERLARRIERDEPWNTPDADRLDSETFATWMRRHVLTRQVRRLLAIPCKTLWGAEPEDVSLLYALAYMRSAGGLAPLLDTAGGAQESRFVGGPHLVARRVADELGERVRLSSPVRRIEQREGELLVRGEAIDVRARRAIVAIPPPLAARIDFDPPLAAAREELCQRMPMGMLMKCFAVYDEPFWRDDGLSGEAVSDRGPATITFDTSPPDGSRGVMLGFVGGAEARALVGVGAEERRRAVLEGLERLFGTRAGRPDDWIEQVWPAEPWSRGGPVAYLPTGALTALGRALREPAGLVHWAGTETATEWTGYMDGAVRSGERAASEVLAAVS